jgi:UDPglucose 6-dehydrogenase
LSYKVDTAVVEQSPGVAIAGALSDAGYHVVVFDPQALDPAMAMLGGKAEAVADADACAGVADVLVIATPWPAFRKLSHPALSRPDRRVPIIDCWHLLPADEFSSVAELIYLGRGAVAVRANDDLARANQRRHLGIAAL